MRAHSIVVALVVAGVVALALGSIVTLATETATEPRTLAAVGLLVAALLGASAFGIRSSRRLESPYW